MTLPTWIQERFVLKVERGVDVGREIPIEAFPVVIGRGSRADVRLQDDPQRPTMSRRHLELSRAVDGLLVVRDLSANGTRVGDRRLPRGEAVVVRWGEAMWLGSGTAIMVCRESDGATGSGVGGHNTGPLPHIMSPNPTPLPCMIPPSTGPLPSSKAKAPTIQALSREDVLRAAWKRVALKRGMHGVDGVSIDDFAAAEAEHLDEIATLLRRGRYQPLPARVVPVQKANGGQRRISILCIRDRVVQQAMTSLLAAVFEPHMSEACFAYRPNRSAHDALRRVRELLAEGRRWVVDADIEAFFDSIHHPRLIPMLRERVVDPPLRALIERFLGILETAPGIGVAQGAATSPLFGNVYLTPFDRRMEEAGLPLVRYSDDLVLLVKSRREAERALLEAEATLRERLALRPKGDKTRIVCVEQGFTFLGFRFDARGMEAAPKAVQALAERLEDVDRSEPERARRVIDGWVNYFGKTGAMRDACVATGRGVGGHNTGPLPHIMSLNPAPLPGGDDSNVAERFVALFAGREDVHARQWVNEAGRKGYIPCRQELDAAIARLHLDGTETLAAYMVRGDGTVGYAVLDVDTPRSEEAGAEAVRLAWDMEREARQFGIPTYVEDSGGKGRHVWIFFNKPLPAKAARALVRALAARVGVPRRGVAVEVFPREVDADALGSMIKLPFGVHRLTGRRCPMLREEGVPYDDAAAFLKRVKRFQVERLEQVMQRLTAPATAIRKKSDPEPGAVEKVLSGCPLLRGLAEKAARTGHLVHAERLILLYTVGHLGSEGKRYIHQVIARCDNYQPRVTQRFIDEMDAAHPPLSCAKMTAWLSEIQDDVTCCCDAVPDGPYKSPVFFAPGATGGKRPARQRPAIRPIEARHVEDAEWTAVAGELFAEEEA